MPTRTLFWLLAVLIPAALLGAVSDFSGSWDLVPQKSTPISFSDPFLRMVKERSTS